MKISIVKEQLTDFIVMRTEDCLYLLHLSPYGILRYRHISEESGLSLDFSGRIVDGDEQ